VAPSGEGAAKTLKQLFAAQLVVGVFLQLAQQFSGINAVFYYSSDFFTQVRAAERPVSPSPLSPLAHARCAQAHVGDAFYGSVMAAAVNVVATGAAVYVMDTLGRRFLLLVSAGAVPRAGQAPGEIARVNGDRCAAGGMAVFTVLLTVSLVLLHYYPDSSVVGWMAVIWWAPVAAPRRVSPSLTRARRQRPGLRGALRTGSGTCCMAGERPARHDARPERGAAALADCGRDHALSPPRIRHVAVLRSELVRELPGRAPSCRAQVLTLLLARTANFIVGLSFPELRCAAAAHVGP
jgi:hypothetical protein